MDGENKMSRDEFILPEKKKPNIIARFKGLEKKIDKKKFLVIGIPKIPRSKTVPILPKTK